MTSDITMAPPPPPKRQAPSPNQKLNEPVTNDFLLPVRYKLAYTEAWTKLPKWKQVAIEDDRKKGVDNGRLMNEFLREVTRIAEQG